MERKTRKKERFDAAYQSYAKDVYRVCLHLTGNEEDAQDVTQQTFVNFYNRCEDIDSDCTFAYLVCTAENFSRNHLKKVQIEKVKEVT